MLAAVFAVLFGFSLLPGRKPLCLKFAERLSGGILPDGAETYCRRLTWFWFALLAGISLVNLTLFLVFHPSLFTFPFSFSLFLLIPLTFYVEKRLRDRRFSVTFHTSGSTGASKTVVKTFESLAKEVAYHRDHYRTRFSSLLPHPSSLIPPPSSLIPHPSSLLFLSTVDPSHMYGTLWRVMLPKALGASVDPEVILTPEALVAKMRAAEKVFLVTTPSFLARFTAYADLYDVPKNCVEIVTSGALLEKTVSDRTAAVFGVVPRQIFGSTETGGVAARRGDGPWEVFSPVDAASRRVTPDAPPRLAVRSPFSFRRGWYVMGDAVERAPGARTFRLLGRTDRLVKINEERVNLAEMEEKIRALGCGGKSASAPSLFADCALAVLSGTHGPYLGLVLETRRLAASTAPELSALALRKLLLPVFPKGTVPRRFRLVREIPRNAQGKVVNAEVVRLLESALVEPRCANVRCDADEFAADVTFDASAPYFQGHFPGVPILPGVAQLGFAVRCAESLRGGPGTLRCVKKMKFVHVIEPGVAVTLRIVRKGPDEFAYAYTKGETACASGVLCF